MAPATLLKLLKLTLAKRRHLTAKGHRLDDAIARADSRQWVQDRRARTRQLIELGGLVQKAGLVELANDDRALLMGAFIALAERLQGSDKAATVQRWREQGFAAFAADSRPTLPPAKRQSGIKNDRR